MVKRKNKNKEEHMERKIRRLKEKIEKIRRRRHSSSGSCSSNQETDPVGETTVDTILSQEVEQNQETTQEEFDIPVVNSETIDGDLQPNITDIPLDENILNILGDEPTNEENYGANIHKDIAVRWTEILQNGLKPDTTKDILNLYDVPENLKLVKPPLLNPEIKAAVNESFIKRDGILVDKQKHINCVISCLAQLMTNIINDKSILSNNQSTIILKQLSDAGRLLCNLHHGKTNTRKQFLVSGLNKNVRDNIKDLKRDQWIFGAELSEKLRSLKAISKSGAEMKATQLVNKPKTSLRNRQPEASTSRALNWRGPPPPPPHPTATRPNWPAGGRMQPPPPRPAPLPPPRRRRLTARPQQLARRR